MALLPTYRSAFSGQTARNTYGAPNYNMPQIAAPTTPFQRIAIPASASGTAAWAPPSQAAAAPTATGAGGPSLSVNQAANRQVNQIIAPQLAAAQVGAKQQNAAIQQFALALMGKLQPIAGQVGADYNQAIGQTGALADRAATFLQQANPTPQVQALLQSAGAPEAQQQQLAGQLGQTFGGGAAVLNFLGGAVPGREMAADKAAAQSQAEQYPALAALRGQQDLASALAQQQKARATIEGTRGQLYATARQDILGNVFKRQQLAGQQATAKATAAYRGAQLRQGQQKIKQAGQIAAEKRTDAWNLGVLKNNETARYHNQVAQSRKDATAATNRITDERIRNDSNTQLQNSLNEVDRKEHNDTMAALTRMSLTGIDPKTGQFTPAAQKIFAGINAEAKRSRAALINATERKRHDVALENKPQVRGSASTGYYAIYPDGTRRQVIPPGPTAGQKPFHWTYRGGAWSYDPSSGKVTQITKPAPGASGSGAKLSTAASGRYGIQVDTGGQPILRNGKTIPYPKTGSASSRLTAEQAQKETARIDAGLNTMKTGVAPDGTKHPVIDTREAAMAELEKEGYFSSPVLKKMAMARLNKVYPLPSAAGARAYYQANTPAGPVNPAATAKGNALAAATLRGAGG